MTHRRHNPRIERATHTAGADARMRIISPGLVGGDRPSSRARGGVAVRGASRSGVVRLGRSPAVARRKRRRRRRQAVNLAFLLGLLTVGLIWAGRAWSDGHTSRWVAVGQRGTVAVRVARPSPAAPALASPTHPNPQAWYTTALATITWPRPHSPAGIAGYAYSLDRRPDGIPARRLLQQQARLQVRLPADGRWYVHVRARDRAGAWGAVATYPLQVDRQPVAVGAVQFAHVAFDPDVEGEPMAFTLAGVARVRLEVHAQGSAVVARTIDGGLQSGAATVTWDGRDRTGRLLPEGSYRLVLTATDPFGRQAVADYSDIMLLRRRVVVSLRQQRLVAYEGVRAVASTLVTTGNRLLPTPVGIFHVLATYHPFHMVSPWPPSSPDYYAPVELQYALLFDERGLFIHDAPWRHRFGPGSNAEGGRPGQDLTGTHGCINVPGSMAAWLAGWAPVGAAVMVVP